MKAVFCSLTHTKTYFEGNISRGVFHIIFWGYRGCGKGMCDQKRQKMTTHRRKIANHSWIHYEGSILFPYPHQNIFWRKYLHGSILHSILRCVGGMRNQKGDKWPPIGKNRKSLQNPLWRLYFVPVPTPKHILRKISPEEYSTVFWGCRGCGRGICDQKGKKWPPTGKKSQISQKSNMKALFCSRTHTKTCS